MDPCRSETTSISINLFAFLYFFPNPNLECSFSFFSLSVPLRFGVQFSNVFLSQILDIGMASFAPTPPLPPQTIWVFFLQRIRRLTKLFKQKKTRWTFPFWIFRPAIEKAAKKSKSVTSNISFLINDKRDKEEEEEEESVVKKQWSIRLNYTVTYTLEHLHSCTVERNARKGSF